MHAGRPLSPSMAAIHGAPQRPAGRRGRLEESGCMRTKNTRSGAAKAGRCPQVLSQDGQRDGRRCSILIDGSRIEQGQLHSGVHRGLAIGDTRHPCRLFRFAPRSAHRGEATRAFFERGEIEGLGAVKAVAAMMRAPRRTSRCRSSALRGCAAGDILLRTAHASCMFVQSSERPLRRLGILGVACGGDWLDESQHRLALCL